MAVVDKSAVSICGKYFMFFTNFIIFVSKKKRTNINFQVPCSIVTIYLPVVNVHVYMQCVVYYMVYLQQDD